MKKPSRYTETISDSTRLSTSRHFIPQSTIWITPIVCCDCCRVSHKMSSIDIADASVVCVKPKKTIRQEPVNWSPVSNNMKSFSIPQPWATQLTVSFSINFDVSSLTLAEAASLQSVDTFEWKYKSRMRVEADEMVSNSDSGDTSMCFKNSGRCRTSGRYFIASLPKLTFCVKLLVIGQLQALTTSQILRAAQSIRIGRKTTDGGSPCQSLSPNNSIPDHQEQRRPTSKLW